MAEDPVGFIAWPGVMASYFVAEHRPAIAVAVSFDPAVADDPESIRQIWDTPLPLSLSLETSLFTSSVPFTTAQIDQTLDWIQTLSAFAAKDATEPPGRLELEFATEAQPLNPEPLFELTVSIGETAIRPHAICEVAANLERILDRKIAIDAHAGIWVVRSPSCRFLPAAPTIFAPRPLANHAVSDSAVPIWPYQRGTVLGFDGPPVPTAFAAVDLDAWGRGLASAVDRVLSPEFAAPIAILQGRTNHPPYVDDLRRAKGILAQRFSELVLPLYADQPADPRALAAARKAYSGAMLAALANAYAATAGVVFRAQIDAPLSPPGDGAREDEALELVGMTRATDSSVSMTEASLDLHSSAEQPLAFFVCADAGARSHIPLHWQFQPTGVTLGARRLKFAIPPGWLDLGGATVPLPLRSVPSPLTLLSQQACGRAAANPCSLDDLLSWDYSVEYEQADRCAQDQVHFSMSFDLLSSPSSTSGPDRLFHALAEFATVCPDVLEDLEGFLLPITESTPDDRIVAASAALASFVNLVARVAGEWPALEPSERSPAAGPFTITEMSALRTDSDGPQQALILRLEPPAGSPELIVPAIPGYSTPHPPSAAPYDYDFVSPDGEYLTVDEGRKVLRRKLASPSRNILVSRSARFAASLSRNAQLLFPNPRATAPEFVYDSGPVTFPTLCSAYLDCPQPVDLAHIPCASGPGARRTLAGYLTTFLERAFGPDPASIETRLSGSYEFEASPGLPATVPIFTDAAVAGLPDPTFLSRVILEWIRNTQPCRDGGTIRFDLMVASTATGAPLPLLRLRNVYVGLHDIADLQAVS